MSDQIQACGVAKPSYVSRLLEETSNSPTRVESESIIRAGAAVMYEGKSNGTHPERFLSTLSFTSWYRYRRYCSLTIGSRLTGQFQTATTITSFFLAMTLFPDVYRKAQAEMDTVVGRSRLPTHADRPSLPYLESVLKETFRYPPARFHINVH